MSAKVCGLIWEVGPTDRASRFVLLAIADNATDDGYAFPGIALLSAKCLFEVRQVMRAIQKLEAEGWLRVSRKAREGKRSEYHIDVEKLELAKDDHRSRDKKSRDKKSRDIYDLSQVTSTTDSGDIHDKPPYPLIGVTVREPSEEPSGPPSLGLFPEDVKKKKKTTAEIAAARIREYLFPYFCDATEHNPKTYTLTESKLKKGVSRLLECLKKTGDDGPAAEQMFAHAIQALADDDWNMGRSPRSGGKKNNDWIDHLCESEDIFEKRLARWSEDAA